MPRKSLKKRSLKRMKSRKGARKGTRKGGMDTFYKMFGINRGPPLTREQREKADSWANSQFPDARGIEFEPEISLEERRENAEKYIKYQQELMKRKKMIEQEREKINKELEDIKEQIRNIERENKEMAQEDYPLEK